MKEEEAIEISQVSNGYLIFPRCSMHKGEMRLESDAVVCQSFAELAAFLQGHFTHRAQNLEVDQ